MSAAKIIAVSVSETTGVAKENVPEAKFVPNLGVEGDAHSGDWHRQVSLLAVESINKVNEKGIVTKPGDFAENLTTEGIELHTLPVGTRLNIGEGVIMEVTQIGKKCHTGCAVFERIGDCIMPREGIFAKVIEGGVVRPGDSLETAPCPEQTDQGN